MVGKGRTEAMPPAGLSNRDEPEFYALPRQRPHSLLFSRALTFILLFLLWLLLSGRFDFFHMGLGVLSCILITFFSGDLLLPELQSRGLFLAWVRFVRYILWLLYQILLANLNMLWLVFHPRMMERIDPQIVRFQSSLTKELALVTLANAITLTPGTITVYMSVEGEFKVHAIDRASGAALPGEMERRVATAFGEH